MATDSSVNDQAPLPSGTQKAVAETTAGARPGTEVGAGVAPPNGVYPTPVQQVGPAAVPVAPEKPRAAYRPTRSDGLFVLYCAVLGFFCVRWVVCAGFAGWGVFAFALLFAAGVLAYARAKRVKPGRESWYWLAVMLLCGLSFALWTAGLLQVWQTLLLLGAAVYWCACLFGTLMRGKTSNMLPLDVLNLLFAVPARNLDTPAAGLRALARERQRGKAGWKRLGFVLLGVVLCVPLLAVVLPMLARADPDNFGGLLNSIGDAFATLRLWAWLEGEFGAVVLQLFLGVPVAWYLASLLAGAAHRRYAKNIGLEGAERQAEKMRVVPRLTVLMVLFAAAVVYGVFIACQIPYFFSAFDGVKPAAFDTYSTYARQGFFELCQIAAINLVLVLLAGCFCRVTARDSRALRVANLLLAGLTLLIVATAFSKMALYIATPSAHGFTPKRIMTCVFMIFLAGVFVALIVFQFRRFSLVRFAALFGAGLLCALCLCNMNSLVASLNAGRYRQGTLAEFNAQIILRGGPAGVPAALDIYGGLDPEADYEQRQRLAYAITEVAAQAQRTEGTSRDTLASALVRGMDIPWDAEADRERYQLFSDYYTDAELME